MSSSMLSGDPISTFVTFWGYHTLLAVTAYHTLLAVTAYHRLDGTVGIYE